LGAKTGTEQLTGLLAGEGRMEHVASGPYLSLTSAPILIGDRSKLLDSIALVNRDSLIFRFTGGLNTKRFEGLRLQPYYTIHDARYLMYWWQLTNTQYETIRSEERRVGKEC
jgi:hypothetical protein